MIKTCKQQQRWSTPPHILCSRLFLLALLPLFSLSPPLLPFLLLPFFLCFAQFVLRVLLHSLTLVLTFLPLAHCRAVSLRPPAASTPSASLRSCLDLSNNKINSSLRPLHLPQRRDRHKTSAPFLVESACHDLPSCSPPALGSSLFVLPPPESISPVHPKPIASANPVCNANPSHDAATPRPRPHRCCCTHDVLTPSGSLAARTLPSHAHNTMRFHRFPSLPLLPLPLDAHIAPSGARRNRRASSSPQRKHTSAVSLPPSRLPNTFSCSAILDFNG